ncbi:hypothetical protein BGZ68_001436, partial [Mortierella alpina]
RNKAVNTQDLENNPSPKHGTEDGQQSLGKLTLHLQTNTSWSQTRNTLDQVLLELAKVPISRDGPREPSMRLGDDLCESSTRSRDAQSEMGEGDEDLKNRVARSAIVPFSDIAGETLDPVTTAVAAASSSGFLEQEPQLQEFRMLQLQHQSSLRRIQTLKSKQQKQRKPVETEQFLALQHRLQDVQQSLEQLQTLYEQLQPLPALQAQGEKGVRLDPVERMRSRQLRSSMSILQRHLKFTLRQLNYQIETCQSNLVS